MSSQAQEAQAQVQAVESTIYLLFGVGIGLGLLISAVDGFGVVATAWGLLGLAAGVDLLGWVAVQIYRRVGGR